MHHPVHHPLFYDQQDYYYSSQSSQPSYYEPTSIYSNPDTTDNYYNNDDNNSYILKTTNDNTINDSQTTFYEVAGNGNEVESEPQTVSTAASAPPPVPPRENISKSRENSGNDCNSNLNSPNKKLNLNVRTKTEAQNGQPQNGPTIPTTPTYIPSSTSSVPPDQASYLKQISASVNDNDTINYNSIKLESAGHDTENGTSVPSSGQNRTAPCNESTSPYDLLPVKLEKKNIVSHKKSFLSDLYDEKGGSEFKVDRGL